MKILAIESSCDETAACVLHGTKKKRRLLSRVIASQVKTHQRYGGVVPEVAARQHIKSIIGVIDHSIRAAKLTPDDLNAIAVSAGPGLITSLRIGVQTAKTLSMAWNKKLIRVNHIEGHIYANWHDTTNIPLPAICLVVSGGHTELILIKKHGDYKLVGRTRDDAAGEVFDKVAKMLGIGYPGGPKIQKFAKRGNPKRFTFPRPMLTNQNFDFSFSGLKTSVLYMLKKQFPGKQVPLADICASFQQAVLDVLVQKTIRAAQKNKVKSVLLAGGVAANKPLRQQLTDQVKLTFDNKIPFYLPPLDLCTDNADMIALAAYYHAVKKDYISWKKLDADPNWELV